MDHKLIAQFQCCGQTVVLHQATDESYAEVVSTGPYSATIPAIRDERLSVAYSNFVDIVSHVISQISSSDLSIYGQFHAPLEQPRGS